METLKERLEILDACLLEEERLEQFRDLTEGPLILTLRKEIEKLLLQEDDEEGKVKKKLKDKQGRLDALENKMMVRSNKRLQLWGQMRLVLQKLNLSVEEKAKAIVERWSEVRKEVEANLVALRDEKQVLKKPKEDWFAEYRDKVEFISKNVCVVANATIDLKTLKVNFSGSAKTYQYSRAKVLEFVAKHIR